MESPKKVEKQAPPAKVIGPIKFKDKKDRDMVVFDFMKVFGFLPETFIVQKVRGQSSKFVFVALIPESHQNAEKQKGKRVEKTKKALDKGSTDTGKVQSKG